MSVQMLERCWADAFSCMSHQTELSSCSYSLTAKQVTAVSGRYLLVTCRASGFYELVGDAALVAQDRFGRPRLRPACDPAGRASSGSDSHVS